MKDLIEPIVSIALAIVGLATVAVLVSRNANTSGVIKASTGGFSQDLATAISPVTGGSNTNISGMLPDLSYGLGS